VHAQLGILGDLPVGQRKHAASGRLLPLQGQFNALAAAIMLDNHGVGITIGSLETVTHAFAYVVLHVHHFTSTEQAAIHDRMGHRIITTTPVVGDVKAPRLDTRIPLAQGEAEIILAASQDRKSTRLNSSHVKISYAVFCLKKKKEST